MSDNIISVKGLKKHYNGGEVKALDGINIDISRGEVVVIIGPSGSGKSTLLNNIAGAMGWQNSYAHQYAADQQPLTGIRPVDTTPAILTTSLPNYAPIPWVTKLILNRHTSGLIRNAAYDVSQWPILMLPSLPFVPELEETGTPVSRYSLTKLAEKSTVSTSVFFFFSWVC